MISVTCGVGSSLSPTNTLERIFTLLFLILLSVLSPYLLSLLLRLVVALLFSSLLSFLSSVLYLAVVEYRIKDTDFLKEAEFTADSISPTNQANVWLREILQAKLDALIFQPEQYTWFARHLKMHVSLYTHLSLYIYVARYIYIYLCLCESI